MKDKVKISLRINKETTSFDEEILDLIEAAKTDLRISGVKNITDNDPLIIRSVILYCKAHFGLSNPDSDKYAESYQKLKDHLSLSISYIHPLPSEVIG